MEEFEEFLIKNKTLENPFTSNIESEISYQVESNQEPGIPINKKFFRIPNNLLPTEYGLASGKEIYQQNLTNNVLSLLRTQNNQTEILVYIINILFNEISEVNKKLFKRIENKDDSIIERLERLVNIEDTNELHNVEIQNIKNEIKLIRQEVERSNSLLEKLEGKL